MCNFLEERNIIIYTFAKYMYMTLYMYSEVQYSSEVSYAWFGMEFLYYCHR